jgi:hypothetical protein
MLREQLIVNRIEWLPGCVDCKGQRNRERLPEDGLRDNTGIALEQRAVCAVHRDCAGGLKQDAALRAVVGGDGVVVHGVRFYTDSKNTGENGPTKSFYFTYGHGTDDSYNEGMTQRTLRQDNETENER